MELPLEVRREIVLPSGRESVWRLLTDPGHLARWFANEVELDPRPGGRGVFRWASGEERHARVEHVEEERELRFDWAEADGGEATTVTFTLDEAAEGTRVTVVESAPAAALQANGTPALGEWAWAIELLARIRVPAFVRG